MVKKFGYAKIRPNVCVVKDRARFRGCCSSCPFTDGAHMNLYQATVSGAPTAFYLRSLSGT